MALAMGLDAPILNPLDENMIKTIHAFKVLSAEDFQAQDYIKLYSSNNFSR